MKMAENDKLSSVAHEREEWDENIELPKELIIHAVLTEMRFSDLISMSGESKVDKVFTLDLHGHKIQTISNLDKLTHLRCLDLSCNLLQKIEGLENNAYLCELKLYSNIITQISGITGLKNLVQLSLQMNRISNLGKGLRGLSKLEILRLDLNSLTQIDANESLYGCNSLADLNISNNAIEEIHNLSCIHKLEKLDLANNKLSSIQGLTNCSSLVELNLAGNNLIGILEVPTLKSLQTLTVSNNNIKEIRAISQCKYLSELQANNNNIQQLPHKLKTMFPHLQRLELKNNDISDLDGLCSAIRECQTMTALLLDNNPINVSTSDVRNLIEEAAPNITELLGHQPQPSEKRVEEINIETTLREIQHTMSDYEHIIQSKIEDIQIRLASDDTVESSSATRPASRCYSRSRLTEALEFASKHFDD